MATSLLDDGRRVSGAEPMSFICPEDGGPVRATSAYAYACASCGRTFDVVGGVVCLSGSVDSFYEGAYQSHVRFLPKSERLWHAWPLWLVNSGYVWAVRRTVPPASMVLELGCAGGVVYFGRRFRMVGCDISVSSLQALAGTYAHLVQADASSGIPLPTGSVDAVISSYFWEHIPPRSKPALLRECRRVLRPSGKLVFLFDVETDNPLIRRYRAKNPKLYRKLFIEQDDHLGYQRLDENLALLREAGFRVCEGRGLEKTCFQPLPVLAKLAQFNEASFLSAAGVLERGPCFYIYVGFLRVLDVLIGPWLPQRWARIGLAVCERLP